MNWLGVRKKMTSEEVKKTGLELGLTFPSDYCEMIGEINGGGLENAIVDVPSVGNVPYSRNTNLCQNVRGNAIDIFHIFQKRGINCFPIASVGNGDYFCYEIEHWKIVLFLHEQDKTIYVCDSFAQLVELIH